LTTCSILLHAEIVDDDGTPRRLPTRSHGADRVFAAGTNGRPPGRRSICSTAEQRAELAADSPVPNAVEEILRFEPPPVQARTAKDVTFHDRPSSPTVVVR
jgi:hypothetical protein